MFEIKRTNTILYCKHWLETVKFYQQVLEFPINHQNDWFVEFKINDDTFLSIADEQRATIKTSSGDGITLSWQVNDVYKTHENLQAKNVTVSAIKQKWGASVCYFHDPEGHRIELWQTTS